MNMQDATAPLDPQTFGNPETGHFWNEAAEGRLVLKHCRSCRQAHWYPRFHCPHCGSADTEWITSRGDGEIYSFSVMRRAKPPYAIAYVTLDEGISIFTNIVDCDLDALSIGQRVALKFADQKDGTKLPVFSPVT